MRGQLSPTTTVKSTRRATITTHLAHGGHAAEPAVVARKHDPCGGDREYKISHVVVIARHALGYACRSEIVCA